MNIGIFSSHTGAPINVSVAPSPEIAETKRLHSGAMADMKNK